MVMEGWVKGKYCVLCFKVLQRPAAARTAPYSLPLRVNLLLQAFPVIVRRSRGIIDLVEDFRLPQ